MLIGYVFGYIYYNNFFYYTINLMLYLIVITLSLKYFEA